MVHFENWVLVYFFSTHLQRKGRPLLSAAARKVNRGVLATMPAESPRDGSDGDCPARTAVNVVLTVVVWDDCMPMR